MRSLLKYLGPKNGKLASCGILRNTFSVMVKPVAFLKLVACSENPWALHPPFVSVTSPAVCTLDIDVRLHDSGTEITDLWGSPLSVTNTLAVTVASGSVSRWQSTQFSCMIMCRKKCPVANGFSLVRLRAACILPLLSFLSRRGCLLYMLQWVWFHILHFRTLGRRHLGRHCLTAGHSQI